MPIRFPPDVRIGVLVDTLVRVVVLITRGVKRDPDMRWVNLEQRGAAVKRLLPFLKLEHVAHSADAAQNTLRGIPVFEAMPAKLPSHVGLNAELCSHFVQNGTALVGHSPLEGPIGQGYTFSRRSKNER